MLYNCYQFIILLNPDRFDSYFCSIFTIKFKFSIVVAHEKKKYKNLIS